MKIKSIILALFFILPTIYFTGISTGKEVSKSQITISNPIENCKYWITTSSGKRHNSKCRWYQNSKGKCSEEKVGTACKVCGG